MKRILALAVMAALPVAAATVTLVGTSTNSCNYTAQSADRGGNVTYQCDGAVPPPAPTPVQPTPTPSQPAAGDVEIIPTPQLGAHPLIQLEARRTYSVKVPYATTRMMLAIGGTQANTATYVELTFSVVPGDRAYYATPEAAVQSRGGAVYPGKQTGDPNAGVSIGWSQNGDVGTAKYPADGRSRYVNIYSPNGGSTEFYLSGS